MYLKFGKHSDKSVEMLILKDPAYIPWIFTVRNPNGRLAMVKIEALRLIPIFDSKPFVRNCRGRKCTKPATCLSVYVDDIYHPMFWCEDCNPYMMGAKDGKLYIIKTYDDAYLHHMQLHTPKALLRDLVKTMATEKGLPKRVGMKEAEELFGRL